jgi:hypothetical protein
MINKKIFPIHGIIGLGLIIIFWILNWSLTGIRTHLGFFPLWLGYSLFVDAMVYYRKGSSLLKRSLTNYILLFIISAPVWWLFELFNLVTQNWHYVGKELFSDLEYFLLASLSFSTVIPSVFGTAELASTFKWIKNIRIGIRLTDSVFTQNTFLLTGSLLILLIILLPGYFFPFVWIAVYFLVEPINIQLKNRTLLEFTKRADWRPIISLSIGVLICGFFWEMWNFYSYPKWIYTIPLVSFLYVFEMPLLGFIGYPPFALELFAVYHLLRGVNSKNKNEHYIKLL